MLVRLSADTTSAFYTESILNDWINQAHRWACGYKKWPFTEYYDKSGAFTSGTETYNYPNTSFKTDSIRILKIGSDLFEKKNFEDYLRYREDYSDGEDKIFSDYGRILYINPNCASGTIYTHGQLMPSNIEDGDVNDTTDLQFSTAEDEGNQAVILEAMSYAFHKQQKFNEAAQSHLLAKQALEELWQRIADEQFAYQTKDRGIFKRFDILKGTISDDENNPLQF